MKYYIYDPDTHNDIGPFETREHAQVFIRDQLGHRPNVVIMSDDWCALCERDHPVNDAAHWRLVGLLAE